MENPLYKTWMQLALQEAQLAAQNGEVPVGAVLVYGTEVVAKNHNQREQLSSAVAHAEILVIQEANRKLGAWRLNNCQLYVTLEPCLMCAGAIIQARIPLVVFGAKDPKAGAVQSLYQCLADTRLNHRPQVVSGVLENEASSLLKNFFSNLRGATNKTLGSAAVN